MLAANPTISRRVAELARAQVAQRLYDAAVATLQARYRKAPRPDVLVGAFALAGHAATSRAAYAESRAGRPRRHRPSIRRTRELVFYYTAEGARPQEALRIGIKTWLARGGVDTLDAYAWALYASGSRGDARKEMDKALAVFSAAGDHYGIADRRIP